MFSKIIGKVVLKDRAAFGLLMLSVFLLSFIFIIAVSMLFSLQRDQIDAIKDIISFDVRISSDNAEKIEDIKATEGVTGVFRVSCATLYSISDGTSVTLCFADDALYDSRRFLSHFDFFQKPEKGALSSSVYSDFSFYDDCIYVSRGSNDRANVFKFPVFAQQSFAENSVLLTDHVFLSFSDKPAALPFYYAIHTDRLGLLTDYLKRSGISYSTYKANGGSVYSALMIERFLFISVLVFLFVIIFLLLLRLFMRFLNENKSSIAMLQTCGMKNSLIYLLFAAPAGLFAMASSVAGSAAGCLFLSRPAFQRMLFLFLFRSGDVGLNLVPSVRTVFVFNFCFSVCCMVVVMLLVRKIRRTDVALLLNR